MANLNDFISDESIESMMDEISEDPTAIQRLDIPLHEKTRPSLKTPILSGRQMAGTQRLFAASRKKDSVGDDTLELEKTSTFDNPGAMSGVSFDKIYRESGLTPSYTEEFNVYRVEQLLEDDSIAELDEHGRELAVEMALKTHQVSLNDVVEDAKDRTLALDGHDSNFKQSIGEYEAKIKKENIRLQEEIEQYANPRIDRMEENEARLETMRRSYLVWHERMEDEQGRLLTLVSRWTDDSVQMTTKKMAIDAPIAPQSAVGGNTAPQYVVASPPPSPVSSANDSAQETRQVEPEPDAPTLFPIEDSHDILEVSQSSDWSLSEGSTPLVDVDDSIRFSHAIPADSTEVRPLPVVAKSRVPRTVVQWLVTLLAIGLWLVCSFLVSVKLVKVEAPFALALAFGSPLIAAGLMSLLTKGRGFMGGFVGGFFAVLLYIAVVFAVLAHFPVDPLVQQLTAEKLWVVEESGLPSEVLAPLKDASRWYGHVLIDSGLASPPVDVVAKPVSPVD